MPKFIGWSKVIWAAIISEGIALLQVYGQADIIDQKTMLVILPILFGILRLLTNTPVTFTTTAPSPPTSH